MDSLGTLWSGLGKGRRAIVVAATVLVFGAVLLLARGAGQGDMTLLYGNLEDGAAGDILTALDQRGVPYEVRGTAIYVPSVRRDSLRLSLASEGLPANAAQGYELLDGLSGFGTTSQMFDAAYWRAKEGELARTILASDHVRTARVHISSPASRPFQRENSVTAAVTVGTASGRLSAAQVDALRYLVAAAVSGLSPEDVSVIDAAGGLMTPDDDPGGATQPREQDLRARAMRLLEARVGPGNAMVEVSVETVTESEQIVERRIDPDSRVAISTEVEERSNTSQDGGGDDVTVASNLPTGDADGAGGVSASEDASSRLVTNYEISETSREVVRAPGAVRRLTIAVLVDEPTTTDDSGNTVLAPRSPDELTALGDLVGAAVGLDTARGDILTIRAMAFEPAVTLGTDAADAIAAPGAPLDVMSLIRIGVVALVALILGLFVVRPVLVSGRRTAQLPAPADTTAPLQVAGAAAGVGALAAPADTAEGRSEVVDPVTRLRRMIDDRQDETIQILQSWIEEPQPREGA